MDLNAQLRKRSHLLVLLLWCSALPAKELLTLDEVLASARKHFPRMGMAEQRQRAAEGQAQAERGSFDLQLKGKGETQPLGYYNNRQLAARLEQPTTLWGTSIYGGWRTSSGDFPVYEGKEITGRGGELVLGVEVPLLQGGYTDRNRTAIAQAGADVQSAKAGVDRVTLDVMVDAAARYWKWVEAIAKEAVAKELFDIASQRQSWIAARVKAGDLPVYDQVDNERLIVDRQNKLVAAQQGVLDAALELSLYLRDEQGDRRVPKKDLAPDGFPEVARYSVDQRDETLAEALVRRPEKHRVKAEMDRETAGREFAENSLLPELNLFGEASQDMGDTDFTRRQTEARAGLLFTLPLERRNARGRLAAANARLMSLKHEDKLITDQISVQVEKALVFLEATIEWVSLARKEVELNVTLVKGEETRLRQGDSHILFVNLREQALADSKIRLVESLSQHHQGVAVLGAVSGKLD